MNYYCRLCDEFIEHEDVIREVRSGAVITPTGNMLELNDTCPMCGNPLFEEADECICGELKLVKDNLCRRCHKVAEDEWRRCLESVHARVRTVPADAEDIMKTYLKEQDNEQTLRNRSENR